MARKKPLEVGQKVWLESRGMFTRDEPNVSELIVLEANKTSAYIWYEDRKESKTRYKVEQRTHRVEYAIPNGCFYRLWLSREDYETNRANEIKTKELRQKLHNTVDAMSLSQLKKLNESLFGKEDGND